MDHILSAAFGDEVPPGAKVNKITQTKFLISFPDPAPYLQDGKRYLLFDTKLQAFIPCDPTYRKTEYDVLDNEGKVIDIRSRH